MRSNQAQSGAYLEIALAYGFFFFFFASFRHVLLQRIEGVRRQSTKRRQRRP